MAQRGNERDSEKLSCSICKDLLEDPVTLYCGHRHCMECIKAHWDGEDQKRIYSCPQCRKIFQSRPDLEKNDQLAKSVENLKKTGLQDAAGGLHDVACDVCDEMKMKAVKFCLVCQASYCENHLRPHYKSLAFKKHKLVDPSKNLHENICSRHNEVKKLFCRTDQQLICCLCSVEEHKGHDTVSAAAERTKRQRELEVSRQNIHQRIQDRENDVTLLQQQVEAISNSADKIMEDSEKIFCKLICLIQKRSSEVKQQITSQQQTEVSRVKKLQRKLKQEISDLKKKDSEMKKLLVTEDHTQFLHNYPSVSAVGESTPSSSINIRPWMLFEKVTACVSEVSSKVQGILTNMWTDNPLRAINVAVLPPQPEPEPKTRDEFLKYSRNITLEPRTAHTLLVLSEGDRKVTAVREHQRYPDHLHRFTENRQVLSKQSLTERCYWEVDLRGMGAVVAVSYNKIRRARSGSKFGHNEKSWALCCSRDSYKFLHKNKKTPLSSKIGVYLDHRAGILSFYRVSETMSLLHRVQTTFTEPLYAGKQEVKTI
uniref:Tripartite motif-containing protein 16-like n=1 Tax=Acanthochromis polyacanthus TaxID=80966 RepID=A0A3Q1FD50_9TELE